MADVISRLKLDSGEFDSKIKRASQELLAYADHCKKMGLEMGYANKDAKDFAKALGNMNTVSQTARGKLNELTEAFVNLKAMYNNMTDAEKQNTFGKELAASLEKLKGRINDAKKELNDIDKELGNTKEAEVDTKSGLEGLTSALGINVKSLIGWGTALAAGKAALDTVKGAIESNEETHDQLARAIAVTDNVTNQFLRSLATADFSTFINGLQGVIDKTIEAYNAMDEFESFAARFQPWQTAKESEIQTKLMQARAAKAKGENDRAEKLNQEAKDLINQLAKSTKAYGKKQTKGGYATIRSLMGGVNISDSQIAWYADPNNWEKAKQKAEKFAQTQERIKELGKDINGPRRANETEIGYSMRVGTAQAEKNRLEKMLRRDPSLKRAYTMQNLRDSGDSEQAQALTQAFSNIYGNTLAESRIQNLMARADRMEGTLTHSAIGGRKGGKTDKNLDDEQKVQQKINDLLKEALTADADRQGEIRQQVAELQKQQEKYKDIKNLALGILPKDKEAVFTIDGQLSEETKKNLREIKNVTIDDKTMTVTADTQEAMQKVQDLIGQVSTTTLQMKVKSDGAPTFTAAQLEGMSFDNQMPTIRGNRGRAQDKLDLATAAFATGGTSNIDFSNYINGIKNAMSNANLGDELYNSIKEKLKDATTVSTLLQEMMERGLAGADLESTAQALKEKLLTPEGIDQTAIQSFLDELNKQIEEAGGVGLKLNADTGEVTDDKGKGNDDGDDLKKFNEGIGKLSGGLSQVTGGLKAVGVDIPKEVDQVIGVVNGVSQIISGVGTIISLFGTSAMTANTMAVGLNTGAITALIGALQLNTYSKFLFFAGGGIVPHAANGYFVGGNKFSGDTTPIMANAGELVLNKAQQGNLAAQLEGSPVGGTDTQPYLDGEKIFLGLQAYTRRSGLGEIVTSER